MGIIRSIFVCCILAFGALSFQNDTNRLVINPIETMIEKVKKIAKNPLQAAHEEENETLAFEAAKTGRMSKKEKKRIFQKLHSPNETEMLEQTIVKIGALLALGFGEAGATIIAGNMSGSGEVDPMISGNKVVGIFGFCDIRQFTDTTEVLQEEVMIFVNEISEVVHGIVDHFSGAANKNIGDAFLIVWRFGDHELTIDPVTKELTVKKTNAVRQRCDMSVIAFIKTIAGIIKSRNLDKYKANEALNEKMPNYSVKLGFGLQLGWAIEGAIGSDFKIDASYLSQNVKMSDSLEASTKHYGVPLIFTSSLFNCCTEMMKAYCRQIDMVTFKGSSRKYGIFTVDINTDVIELESEKKRELTNLEKKVE